MLRYVDSIDIWEHVVMMMIDDDVVRCALEGAPHTQITESHDRRREARDATRSDRNTVTHEEPRGRAEPEVLSVSRSRFGLRYQPVHVYAVR